MLYKGGPRSFYDIPPGLADLIADVPGSEKSRLGTEIANRYWEEQQLPTLYLMLTHDAIRERLRFLVKDGKRIYWDHYEGHKKWCRISKEAANGYASSSCTCDRGKGSLDADKPTLAALDVVLTDHLTKWSYHQGVQLYRLWIIDEIDLGRFIREQHATERDLRTVRDHYPPEFGAVSTLAKTLLEAYSSLAQGDNDRLEGEPFYRTLDDILAHSNSGLGELLGKLRPNRNVLPTVHWSKKFSLKAEPRNFPPALVPVFCDEAEAYLRGDHFNPRIRLVDQGDRAPLQVRWRLEVVDPLVLDTGEDSPPYVVVLDATADSDLLDTVLPYVDREFRPKRPL